MPQLDYTIIFPQIFWFFSIFILFYAILLYVLLPQFIYSLQLRKQVISHNIKLLNEISCIMNKDYVNTLLNLKSNLNMIQKSIYLDSNKINMIFFNLAWVNPSSLDLKIACVVHNNALFCNKYTFKTLFVFPSVLNFK